MLLADVEVPSQSLKLNLVPRTQVLGQFGPPKKRVNFDLCIWRHKWVNCVLTVSHLVYQNKFSFVILYLLIELFCPLHCLVNSTLWFPQLSKLISFQVHQLFGPPKLALVPCTCALCAETLRTGIQCPFFIFISRSSASFAQALTGVKRIYAEQ